MIDISYTAVHAWLDKDYRSPDMIMGPQFCTYSVMFNLANNNAKAKLSLTVADHLRGGVYRQCNLYDIL